MNKCKNDSSKSFYILIKLKVPHVFLRGEVAFGVVGVRRSHGGCDAVGLHTSPHGSVDWHATCLLLREIDMRPSGDQRSHTS